MAEGQGMSALARRALLAIGVGTALSLAGDATLYAVLPAHAHLVGLQAAQLGLILSLNRWVRIGTNTPAGFLFDRLSHRRLYLAGLWLGILPTVGYALGQGPGILLASRALWGCCWSLILVGGYAVILETTTEATRGRATGAFQMAYFAGGGLGTLLGGVLADLLGFRPAFWGCALVNLVGALVATALLPETNAASRRLEPNALGELLRAGADDVASLLPWLARWWAGLRQGWSLRGRHASPLVVGAAVNFVAYLVTNGILMATLSYFLQQRWGQEATLGSRVVGIATVSGALLASRSAFSIVLAPLAGRLSDRLGKRRGLAGAGLLLEAAGFGVLASPLSMALGGVALGVALVASGGGLLAPTLTAWVADRAKGNWQSVAMGVYATAADLGSAAGPLVAYGLVERTSLTAPYLLAAGAVAAAALLLWGTRDAR
ncbi:MAG: MFS transporter [Anaerolineae bacterium]|nr:MFS transporter [Anaerolineae bacterium]